MQSLVATPLLFQLLQRDLQSGVSDHHEHSTDTCITYLSLEEVTQCGHSSGRTHYTLKNTQVQQILKKPKPTSYAPPKQLKPSSL